MATIRKRGDAWQALLDRGWGKAKVEVVTEGKQDYIAALLAVNKRLKATEGQDQANFLENMSLNLKWLTSVIFTQHAEQHSPLMEFALSLRPI